MRNFVARYLKDRGEKNAALVAFVSPDEDLPAKALAQAGDWRFSLVKMDYRFEDLPAQAGGKSGKVKVREEFTPARRWSFLVGKNEKSHTAQSRLVSILEDDEHNPTLAQLEEAFNIEPVTKEFFDKYRDLLIRTVDALDKIVKRDQTVRKDFGSKNINTVDFAKKLLGQIVFLYFLQKKGWFGVERNAEWGTGPKDFLRRLFNKEYGDYKNFFNDILEPLFYEALARERDDNFYSRFNCKIPFLNGGLFEPIGGYDWVYTDILLPDDLFSNSRRTPEGDIGDGILDVFDRFNFTVKEDDPLEKEVAIDPELLGKLYEKFNAIRPDNFYEYKKALASGKRSLEKQFNKKFGVYYTPREIVHYMCQQSLIYYLSAELEGKVSKEDIEKLIKYGEQFTENEATALIKERRIKEGKQKTSDYESKLPESIRKNAKLIDDKLKNIKVCDPAVGSGAFPVGMMHEIVKTRHVLSAYINKSDRSIYDLKRECIENSLYGVDIDAGACEIAKLRLWLSLIVDEEDIRKIKPLPNLDYKIVCGNSLLGVEKDLFNNELFNQLEKLKPLYFNETNPAKKQEYKNQIEELISKITKGRKEFDFEVYFSEVFHEKGGFDVVIANPPYVSFGLRGMQKISKEWDSYVRKHFPNSAEYKISLYALFMDKGIQLLRNNGILSYITPDSFLLGRYFSKIRHYIVSSTLIKELILFEKDFWEGGTIGRPVISFFLRSDEEAKTENNYLTSTLCPNPRILQNDTLKFYTYPQNYFSSLKYNRFRLFFSEKAMKFVESIECNSTLLGDIAKITTGVRSKIGQKKIICQECKGPTWKRGIISGGQVLPFFVKWEGHYINIDKKLLWAGGWNADIVENSKIMIRQTGDLIIAGIDYLGLYHLNNVHSLKINKNNIYLEFICAILNSKLMNKYYKLISLEFGRTMAQTDIETLELLPIKIPSHDHQRQIVKLVQDVIADYNDDTKKKMLLNQIEEKIAEIYAIDDDFKRYVNDEELY
jgi:hypothetical protein